MDGWLDSALRILITINQILTSGIAITAFSLLLYALSFNLRDRVARSFAAILLCMVILFSADSFGSTEQSNAAIGFWLSVQWVAIIFLPSAYLNFSDALLATTGKPSRWRRKWAVRVSILLALFFVVMLINGSFVGPLITENTVVPHNQATFLTEAFTIYYLLVMAISWYNFIRALNRTLTHASKRRMIYLTLAALGPAVGSFPFLLYGSAFATNIPVIFWFIAIGANVALTIALVAMAYSVAYFGVPWPDRLVKSRLFKWLLRGPVTASLTLAVVTIIRRLGVIYGTPYSAFVPISMTVCILLSEFLITIFFPYIETRLFFGRDSQDIETLRSWEEKLITRSDLNQFLEMVLASVCDRLQAKGAYLAGLTSDGLEVISETGTSKMSPQKLQALEEFVMANEVAGLTYWQEDRLFPVTNGNGQGEPTVVGYLGILGFDEREDLDREDLNALQLLSHRAALVLKDRDAQEQIFRSLESMTPQVDMIQQLRAAGRYDSDGLVKAEESFHQQAELSHWIKDALTHYWGGPRLSESPLLQLAIVKEVMPDHENNPQNALRSILRSAIEQMRPEGDRKFTSEWLLYNILDLKFMEGKRVREIARRLAISEADLYRKQRVAVEAIANNIVQMEVKALESRHDNGVG